MSLPHEVAHGLRGRLANAVSRNLTDGEVLTIGLAASCQNAQALLDFLCDRHLARELSRQRLDNVAMTLNEFEALFSSFRPARSDLAAGAIHDSAFKAFVTSVDQNLQCTIAERDQKAAWSQCPVKVLVYVALHAEMDTEERVCCALGGVVRADLRRLEDLRASFEGVNMDLLSVGASIVTLVRCMSL
jgi:hypothetical protein